MRLHEVCTQACCARSVQSASSNPKRTAAARSCGRRSRRSGSSALRRRCSGASPRTATPAGCRACPSTACRRTLPRAFSLAAASPARASRCALWPHDVQLLADCAAQGHCLSTPCGCIANGISALVKQVAWAGGLLEHSVLRLQVRSALCCRADGSCLHHALPAAAHPHQRRLRAETAAWRVGACKEAMTGEAGLVLACHETQEENHSVQEATHSPGKQPSRLCDLLTELCEGAGCWTPAQSAQDGLN